MVDCLLPWAPTLNSCLLLVHVGQLQHQQVKECVRGQGHRLPVGLEDGEHSGRALRVVQDVSEEHNIISG